jgi:hypothetical protein
MGGEDEEVRAGQDLAALERRLRRQTWVVIGGGTLVAAVSGGRRAAIGFLLGGAISLLNERWLRASTLALLGTAAATRRAPRMAVAKFILRYLVMAAAVAVALWSGEVSLLGLGLGLASFVGAVMIEAGFQLYLAVRDRDQTRGGQG